MNILIIGSGGREHALAWRCAQDNFVKNVFVCPGNAGTYLENKVSNVEMDSNDFDAIEKFCVKENIELVIIGPEQPLVMGLTDFLQSKNIKTFGAGGRDPNPKCGFKATKNSPSSSQKSRAER